MEMDGIQRLLDFLELAEFTGSITVEPSSIVPQHSDAGWYGILELREGKLSHCEVCPLPGTQQRYWGQKALAWLRDKGALTYMAHPQTHPQLLSPRQPPQQVHLALARWCPIRTRFGEEAIQNPPSDLARLDWRVLVFSDGSRRGHDIARLCGNISAEQLFAVFERLYASSLIVFKDEVSRW